MQATPPPTRSTSPPPPAPPTPRAPNPQSNQSHPEKRARQQRVLLWMVLAVLAVLYGGWAGWVSLFSSDAPAGMPQAAGRFAGAGHPYSAKFPCLSYAPFRQAHWRPDRPDLIIPADAIERDLQQIAAASSCVRLYGTANGLHQAPEIARRLGLRLWLGVWLGSNPQFNDAEMQRASALAGQYADIVDRVVVGSEVLLRGDLTVSQLQEYLRTMQAQTAVPVAYADVWEFWLQHAAQLRPDVDEAVIHILPYWENTPVALHQATDHVMDVWRRVEKTLVGLPVVLGETGWPAAGRQRGDARPGVIEQRQFVSQMLDRLAQRAVGADRQGTDRVPGLPGMYEVPGGGADHSAMRAVLASANVIEAFDQPWKADSEGVAGAAWGVLESASWRSLPATVPPWLFVSALMCVTLLLAGALSAASAGKPVRKAGDSKPMQDSAVSDDTDHSGALSGAWGARELHGLCCVNALWLLVLLRPPVQEWLALDWASTGALIRLGALCAAVAWGVSESVNLVRAWRTSTIAVPDGSVLREVGQWCVAVYVLLLIGDGRYMDLSWQLVAMPALPWAMRVWVLGVGDERSGLSTARAGLLAGSAVAIVQVEGWNNEAAVALSMWVLLVAVTSVKR